MVLNKLWIPDVLIDIIKDYLYIDRFQVLKKFYKQHINRCIADIDIRRNIFVDMFARPRLLVWKTGYIYGGGDLFMQGTICLICGDCSQLHNNTLGCCRLMWDLEDEPLELVIEGQEVSDETVMIYIP